MPLFWLQKWIELGHVGWVANFWLSSHNFGRAWLTWSSCIHFWSHKLKWYLLFKGILWSRDLLVKTIKAHELESNMEKSFLFAPLTQSASFWCFSDMIYGNELVLDLWFESRFRFLYIVPNIKLFKAWTGGVLTNSWNYCLKTFSFVIQNNGQSHLGASFVRWTRKLTCLAFVWILTPGETDPQPIYNSGRGKH